MMYLPSLASSEQAPKLIAWGWMSFYDNRLVVFTNLEYDISLDSDSTESPFETVPMSRSRHSPRDARQDHPSARSPYSPAHAPFPSTSEFSDSLEVYSHAHFSPPCPSSNHTEPKSSSFRHRDKGSSTERRPSHRDRLNDPQASSLDLDDEFTPGSSINTADTIGRMENDEQLEDEEDPSHRISVRGPKIRFHSRAPWETGEDTIEENDSVYSGKSGTFGRKVKSKTVEAAIMRHFGRGSSRPSTDSSRSQPKASFETTARCSHSSSRGAL